MKKNWGYFIIYFLTLAVVIFNVSLAIKESLFFNINDLPEGSLLSSQISPDGKKTLNLYLIDNSLGTAVRGEVVSGNEKKNVYWQTGTTDVSAFWNDNHFVVIDEIPLDITKGGEYDCRRGKSLFQEGAVEGFTNTADDVE